MRNRLVSDEDQENKVELISDGELRIPTALRLRCYDITKHLTAVVPVDHLEEYIYDPSVKNKLILPESSRNLLDVLIDHEESLMEDIIKGKTGGIIVLATGRAGLGKTLTAEVYSEVMEKPLYVVQSSQLGIEINEIENNLLKALKNASRWKAILMIDEADTYIHERGNDITQNCIVGVFLRVLEYYNGVLFMTSNRPEVVDDAIMSRCTAHLHYVHPDQEELLKIWEVLSKQFKVEISTDEVQKIIDHHPNMAGRDVKNTVKLMKLISQKTKEPCDFKLFMKLYDFMNYRSENHGGQRKPLPEMSLKTH
jgi:SpoVK/Ycf46/Vps4 family AAA+-type ATPase